MFGKNVEPRRIACAFLAAVTLGLSGVARAEPPKKKPASEPMEVESHPVKRWPWQRKLAFVESPATNSVVPDFKVGDMGVLSFPDTIASAEGPKPTPPDAHFRLISKLSPTSMTVRLVAWEPTRHSSPLLISTKTGFVNYYGPPFSLNTYGTYIINGISVEKYAPDEAVALPKGVWEVLPVGPMERASFILNWVDMAPYRAERDRLEKERAKEKKYEQEDALAALNAQAAATTPITGQASDEWFTVTLTNGSKQHVAIAEVAVTRGKQTEIVKFKEIPAGKTAKKTVRLKGKGKVECRVVTCSI